jgi:hypothetical protein
MRIAGGRRDQFEYCNSIAQPADGADIALRLTTYECCTPHYPMKPLP